ncbi:MAG TPA: S8 family serine peptidase [Burkholderiales bacterium]|nr:S8 family serine peptidase [Burkholderiales bacterium]
MRLVWIAACVPALFAQVVPDRYIVELTSRPAVGVARANARAEQARVRPALERSGARVLASLDTVANALIVAVPDTLAPRLAGVSGVARVHPVRLARPYLDHALALHKVSDAWAAIGGSAHAGAGIKIAIIDSGIAQDHPAFQSSTLAMPPGFPRANSARDLAYTNNKVIVARNYVSLGTPQDAFGHGTAVAMEAAGAPVAGPLGTITGVAPGAWLGSYKVYQNQDPFGEDTVLQAIEDAVNDGMDVINLSLGVPLAERLPDDILVAAVERAAAMGVVVAVAAGNSGDTPSSIASPASAPSAIAVGASANDRMFAPALVRDGTTSYFAIPGYGPARATTVTAALADVAALDGTGQACLPLALQSLAGRIAMIARSPRNSQACSFAYKLNNAQSAGAVAAIVYMNPDSPDVVTMDISTSTLPAVAVNPTFAENMRQQLRQGATPTLSIDFTTSSLPRDPNALASFSSRGPNVDLGIKPDLTATGAFIYTATQKTNPNSFLYGATGFLKEADGTSFSAPLVSGAAALLKAARPGLTAAQYRSLLVNSAGPLAGFPVQWTGAGLLNASAALAGKAAVAPVSLGFGAGGGTADVSRDLLITNLGGANDTFTISADASVSLASNTVTVAAGATQNVAVRFSGSGLAPGSYQGFLRIRGTQSAVETVVPWWYGVPDRVPKYFAWLQAPDAGSPGTAQHIYFRITDLTGVPLISPAPVVRAVSLLGTVASVTSEDALSPGVFHAIVVLGEAEGTNVFQIQAGALMQQIAIVGQF